MIINKKPKNTIVVSLFSLLISAPCTYAATINGVGTWESTLQPRDLNGDGYSEAYYDTNLNLTWLINSKLNQEYIATNTIGVQPSHAPNTWQWAKSWAQNLSMSGIDGWRLPSFQADGKFELSDLFYRTLGNSTPPDQTSISTGYFTNVSGVYWSEAQDQSSQGIWVFNTQTGNLFKNNELRPVTFGQTTYYLEPQTSTSASPIPLYTTPSINLAYAWAVHDGDIGTAISIPEPATTSMIFMGLIGIIFCTRKNSTYSSKS